MSIKRPNDILLLLPVVIVFYAVMTLEVEKVLELVWVEVIKFLAALISVFFIVRYNVVNYRRKRQN